MLALFVGILVFAMIGIGARWLFRQRDPDEIHAAREKLKRIRRK